jgi:hypothetical protein
MEIPQNFYRNIIGLIMEIPKIFYRNIIEIL